MVCLKRPYSVSCASLAQLVEHRSRKAGVTSSSLVAGSMKSQVVALWWLPFLCEWLELFDCFSATETALPEWCCQNSAARNAPSWVVILALPEQRCQKCAKYGLDCHTYCKFGIFEPYLLQVWQRCSGNTKAIKELQASHTKKAATTKPLPAISWSQLPDLNW